MRYLRKVDVMRTSEEREILERLAERPEVLSEWSLILRVLSLTHMDKAYYQVLGLLKDYSSKKLKEIETAYEKQSQQIPEEVEMFQRPANTQLLFRFPFLFPFRVRPPQTLPLSQVF